MNIPIGQAVEQCVSFSETEPFGKINGLMQSGFEGYVVATVEGISGLEEGLLMIKGNEVVGAVFDALRLTPLSVHHAYGIPAFKWRAIVLC